MQTFLPFPDFYTSARLLDSKRLGKQRVEVKQILKALRGESKGWVNHPAVKMWKGYEKALLAYGIEVCKAWRDRGFKDRLLDEFQSDIAKLSNVELKYPPWFGDVAFHRAHRSNLLRKNPTYYSQFFPYEIGTKIPYVWPGFQETDNEE